MPELVKPSPKSPYTAKEVTEALVELAVCSGNARRASAQLAERGFKIDHTTLYVWKNKTYAEDYRRLHEEELTGIYDQIAANAEAVVQLAGENEIKGMMLLADKLERLEGRELAQATAAVSKTKQINSDISSTIRGKPTKITATFDASDALERLAREFGQIAPGAAKLIEGTAAEIPEGSD